jgi:hypothetical protein
MKEKKTDRRDEFCRAYLRCMDAERAAAESGCGDGFAMLSQKGTRARLAAAREASAGEICREDVIRRLCQLAFGRANDGVRLALMKCGADEVDALDLSEVSEFKAGEKGNEVKFADRVKALETLYALLGSDGNESAFEELFGALRGESE